MIGTVSSLTGTIHKNETIAGNLNVGVDYIEPRTQEKSVAPTTEVQEVVPDETYTGLSKVTVGAIEDEDLVSENIKQGVNILGVEGNFAGAKYKPRHIYPSATGLFRNYTGTELDYETNGIDVTNFPNLDYMFNNCVNLTHLNLGSWNTENVKSLSGTFGYCSSLINLDLNSWNTQKLDYMNDVFRGCTKLEDIKVSNWNTSNVTRMYGLFFGCNVLPSLDLSSWNTENVTNMSQLFGNCYKLKFLDIRNFTFDKVTSYSSMFASIPTDCLIIVKGQTEKDWVLARRSQLTNVKTVEEYEAM